MKAITLVPCGRVIISSFTSLMRIGLEDSRGSRMHMVGGSRPSKRNAIIGHTSLGFISLQGLAWFFAHMRTL